MRRKQLTTEEKAALGCSTIGCLFPILVLGGIVAVIAIAFAIAVATG